MTAMQIITRIIPSSVSPQKWANLLSAQDIDVPERVSRSMFTDPRSCIRYNMETTFCKEFPVEPDVNADNLLYEKCEAVAGLMPLAKYDRALPLRNEVCVQPGALDHDLPFTLAIPIKIERSKNVACTSGHFPRTNALDGFCQPSDPSDSLLNPPPVSICNGNNLKESDPSENILVSNGAVEEVASWESEIADDPPNKCIQNDNIIKQVSSSKNGLMNNGAVEALNSSDGKTMEDSSEIITSIQDLIEPLKKHFVDNKCLLCGFVSTSKSKHSARKHLITHLDSRNFKCSVCDKTFKTPNGLFLHKNVHLPNKARTYACKICDKTFLHRGNLSDHMRKTHSSKSFVCPICNHKFSTAMCLKSHQTIHTGEKPYECDNCNKRFRTSKSLSVHKTTHNGPELHLSCSVCDKKFRYQRHLKIHMNKHELSPKFKCEFCDKAFNFHSNMLQHKLVHSDHRRHNCETCGMKFKFPHHLKSHIATHDS